MTLSTEGPFKKGYAGSYLINYRYSTLALLAKMGLPLSSGGLFQDVSFNIWLPTNKLGNFSVFGFGGLSSNTALAKRDSAVWQNSFDRLNITEFSNTGAVGITHTKVINSKNYIKSVLATSATDNGRRENALNAAYIAEFKNDESYWQNKLTFSSTLNHKYSSKVNLRSGLIINRIGYSIFKRAQNYALNISEELFNTSGQSHTFQTFAQLNFSITEKLTLNTGLHYFQFLLNNSNALEPRSSLRYDLNTNNSLSLGYGLHSQLQPLGIYFFEVNDSGQTTRPNKNLGLSKAHHFVFAYDWRISEQMRLKTEIYYQLLFNIPISPDSFSTYSILNNQNGYPTQKLVNGGEGNNYGIEITLEKLLHKNYYLLLSTSLFDSKYTAEDGIWRNTLYNTNYNFVFTAGKERTLPEKFKRRIIAYNLKAIYTGGFRRTPIDIAKSMEQQETVFIEDKAFTERNPDYFRIDIRISVKRNYAKLTSTLAFDIQNLTNYKNVRMQYFDPISGKIKTEYQIPLVPILSYRIEF